MLEKDLEYFFQQQYVFTVQLIMQVVEQIRECLNFKIALLVGDLSNFTFGDAAISLTQTLTLTSFVVTDQILLQLSCFRMNSSSWAYKTILFPRKVYLCDDKPFL